MCLLVECWWVISVVTAVLIATAVVVAAAFDVATLGPTYTCSLLLLLQILLAGIVASAVVHDCCCSSYSGCSQVATSFFIAALSLSTDMKGYSY